jgi:type I restriction enzyme S subunit
MKPYPVYRESGIAWLGKIPSHWALQRMKTAVTSSVNGVWGNEEQGDNNDVICIRVADFDMATLGVSTRNLTVRNITESQQNGRTFNIGDLLIEKSGGGENQPVGRMIRFDLQNDKPAICSNFVGKLSIRDSFDSNFFLYYSSSLYAKNVNTRSIKQTTGIQNLDLDSYLCELMPVPTLPEQQAIADYLDRKTAVIDTLIAKKERQIELLQEQRTAVINHAVTKGLNPHAPRKDSGIPWLGQIPSHWSVEELRRSWKVIDCKHKTATYVENGIHIVSTTEIKPGRLKLNGRRFTTYEDFADLTEGERLPKKGDIIYSRNASLGSAAYVDTDERFCMGQDVCMITSPNQNQLFLSYQLNSPIVLEQLESMMIGATFKRINIAQIRLFIIVCPPIEEQNAIADYLDKRNSSIDKTMSKLEQIIELLREYRTAVISAAVTGKIDVRPAAANSEKP